MSAWPTARIEQCAEIVSGATPSTSEADYWDGDIHWATPKDLSELEGAYLSDTPRKITKLGLESCAATILPPNSVLFSSRAPIGHVAINTVPMATNQGFKSFVPRPDRLHPKFLYYWLRKNRQYLESLGNGATFKEVSKAVVSRIAIPLPPLPEQRRIAEILDKADALRARRRAALGRLDDLTQSIFLHMFGDPARNTHGFETITLGQLGDWKSGGTPPRTRSDYFTADRSGIPWFSSGELNRMYATESIETISAVALSETSAKRVPRGSLMLGMYDTAALKGSLAAIDCSCNQAVAFAKVDETRAHPVFVYFAIQIGREHYRRLQRGIRQKNLNLSMVRGIQIPRPAIEVQRKFAVTVERIGALSDVHNLANNANDSLFHSLMLRAFRGEL